MGEIRTHLYAFDECERLHVRVVVLSSSGNGVQEKISEINK